MGLTQVYFGMFGKLVEYLNIVEFGGNVGRDAEILLNCDSHSNGGNYLFSSIDKQNLIQFLEIIVSDTIVGASKKTLYEKSVRRDRLF